MNVQEIADRVVRDNTLEKLIDIRKANGVRQIDVAKAMGIGQPSVSELERGETSPRLETLQRYARAVGVELSIVVVERTEEDDD